MGRCLLFCVLHEVSRIYSEPLQESHSLLLHNRVVVRNLISVVVLVESAPVRFPPETIIHHLFQLAEGTHTGPWRMYDRWAKEYGTHILQF
jgi:hypothetical protein